MLLTRLWWTGYKAYHVVGQARYPYKPLANILRDQSHRVRAAVTHAYKFVPYYRETMIRLGLTPADFHSADDLQKLPLLERRQLQRDPEYFVSGGKVQESWFKYRTGGSTGSPVTVYHDTAGMMRMAACSHREGPVIAALVGRSRVSRYSMVTCIPGMITALHSYINKHCLALPGRHTQYQHLNLKDPVPENLRRLNDYQPDILRSYGSFFGQLIAYLETSGALYRQPKLIAYVADRLPESVRHLINDRYGVPVLSDYGAIEALKIGIECEAHRGYHLNLDLYPVRLIDGEGNEVPPGETGEVVVSDLVNRGTVILNYPLGDLAALLPDPCPCGRTLPMLSFPDGRLADKITLPSGEKLYPSTVIDLADREQEIYQFQVVQKALDRLEVRLVPTEQCNREDTKNRLTEAFLHLLGPDLRVEVVFVSDVERTPMGKVRQVLSLFPETRIDGPTA